jgi:hypothetical protein
VFKCRSLLPMDANGLSDPVSGLSDPKVWNELDQINFIIRKYSTWK